MEQYDNYRFCDSLDYLIPPVKKQNHHFLKKPEAFRNLQDIRESYISTCIKGNTKEVIREKYSGLNPKDKYILQTILPFDGNKQNKRKFSKNSKPIIKITVVPKSVETQTSKVFNKKILQKQIKNTSSNHEGFHSNNVYTVSGKRRVKIYKIKSSESDNFSNRRNYYLNKMDRNNFKDKRKKNSKNIFNDGLKECKITNCPNRLGANDINRHRSRVTIVGRLGLTNDDKYVLNCAATVDDKPIHTNITQDVSMNNKHDEQPIFEYSKPLRNYSPRGHAFRETECNNICSKMESQGIQVNLNNDSENIKKYGSMKNKYSQCVCTNTDQTIKSTNETVKGHQSPIVVISVYPKDYGHEGHMVKVEERHLSPKAKTQTELQQKVSDKQKKSSSRPVSPPNNKDYLANTKNNNIFRSNMRSVSPNRFPNSSRKDIPLGSSKTDVLSKKSKENYNTKANLSRKIYQRKQELHREQDHSNVENLHTSQSLAKKALVDKYISKVENQKINNYRKITTPKYTPPNRRASKVTVNIDGESERYDLLFKHDRQNTDFTVRKTVKSKKKTDVTSMDNLLILTDDTEMGVSNSFSHSPNPRKVENLNKKSSNLNVRDSIEVFHGRTSSGSPERKLSGKYKNSMANNSNKERAKHYRGDPCSVPDPSERDKEIRQLLGILTGRNLNEPKQHTRESEESFVVKTCEERCTENDCSKQKINISCSLAKLFPKKLITKLLHKSNADLNYSNEKSYELEYRDRIKPQHTEDTNITICDVTHDGLSTKQNDSIIIPNDKNLENGNNASLVLNRNIHVFLEVEQFTRQKPIMLTRKQYNKVKRTIQRTVWKKFSNEKRVSNYYSSVSIGEVRVKSKFKRVFRSSKEVQTDSAIIKKEISSDMLSEKFRTESLFSKFIENDKKNKIKGTITEKNNQISNKPRNVVSSVEVRHTSVSYMRHVTYSTPACSKDASSYSLQKDSNSIHTIFKGRKKSITPNLGTSAYSLYSSNSDYTSTSKRSQFSDSKKKPLLQRLVSCLIMRSKVSHIKIGKPPQKEQTKNSSIDSYNISTSFAGMELTSSLYDTSISFYSKHTILPVNKMKRSFFSSVKGFLTNHRN